MIKGNEVCLEAAKKLPRPRLDVLMPHLGLDVTASVLSLFTFFFFSILSTER